MRNATTTSDLSMEMDRSRYVFVAGLGLCNAQAGEYQRQTKRSDGDSLFHKHLNELASSAFPEIA
jgi:hypothetical protein